jgi:hypothetical protein
MDKEKTGVLVSNDIRDIHTYKQLNRVKLDIDSPRLLKACHKLGIEPEELQLKDRSEFDQKNVPKDVVDLRYKVCYFNVYRLN